MKIPAAKIYFSEEDRKDLQKQIDEILESGQLTLGKYTREFEERNLPLFFHLCPFSRRLDRKIQAEFDNNCWSFTISPLYSFYCD